MKRRLTKLALPRKRATTTHPDRKGRPTGSNQVDASNVMTLPEVAAYLACHDSTVYRLVRAGELPAFRLGGGNYRFLRSEVDRWIGERHAGPHTPGDSGGRARGKAGRKG